MPLTEFQRDVLRLLARFRSPDSYLAGATVINRAADTPRFSEDLDLFHDAEEAVTRCAEADAAVLSESGFALSWKLRRPAFQRVVASKDGASVRLDWAIDSAFRFFPVQRDEDVGYLLHLADAAANKALALAGRREARDLVDVLHLHETYLSLGAICWAACAKDPGFTPEFLLQEMGRNANFRPAEFEVLSLARPFDPIAAKHAWLEAAKEARALFDRLPASEAGCLYLEDGEPLTPRNREHLAGLTRLRGSLHGVWPTAH